MTQYFKYNELVYKSTSSDKSEFLPHNYFSRFFLKKKINKYRFIVTKTKKKKKFLLETLWIFCIIRAKIFSLDDLLRLNFKMRSYQHVKSSKLAAK